MSMPLPTLRLIRPSEGQALSSNGPEGEPKGHGSVPSARSELDRAFRMYAPEVAARGLVMLGSSEEADDLVQDVFVRAFRAIGKLTDPAAIRMWLLTIAVREALRRLRKRRLSRLLFGRPEVDFEALADPGASQDIKLQIGNLFRELEQLPPDLRVAWVLRYFENETIESVAAQCGWSLSTTKRRVTNAHALLMKRLGA